MASLTSSVALRVRDFQVGGEISLDSLRRNIDRYSLGVSLNRSREKAAIVVCPTQKTVTGAYLQKFSDQLEIACRTTWTPKVPSIGMEIGARWWLLPPTSGYGRNSFIKAKLDNGGRFGISLSSDVRPGMQVILGAIVDSGKPLITSSQGTHEVSNPSHKLGMQILYTI